MIVDLCFIDLYHPIKINKAKNYLLNFSYPIYYFYTDPNLTGQFLLDF